MTCHPYDAPRARIYRRFPSADFECPGPSRHGACRVSSRTIRKAPCRWTAPATRKHAVLRNSHPVNPGHKPPSSPLRHDILAIGETGAEKTKDPRTCAPQPLEGPRNTRRRSLPWPRRRRPPERLQCSLSRALRRGEQWRCAKNLLRGCETGIEAVTHRSVQRTCPVQSLTGRLSSESKIGDDTSPSIACCVCPRYGWS